MPDSTFEPSTPDADAIMLSLGSEITTKVGKIEIAFTSVLFEERKIKEGGAPYYGNYNGKYSSDAYALTLGYKKEF